MNGFHLLEAGPEGNSAPESSFTEVPRKIRTLTDFLIAGEIPIPLGALEGVSVLRPSGFEVLTGSQVGGEDVFFGSGVHERTEYILRAAKKKTLEVNIFTYSLPKGKSVWVR